MRNVRNNVRKKIWQSFMHFSPFFFLIGKRKEKDKGICRKRENECIFDL